MKRFLQLEVWNYMRKHESVTSREVAELVGPGALCVLMKLRNRGCAVKLGKAMHTRWRATDKAPECMWGLHPRSVANLVPGDEKTSARALAARLAKCRAGTFKCPKGLRRVHHTRKAAHGATTLEQVWR